MSKNFNFLQSTKILIAGLALTTALSSCSAISNQHSCAVKDKDGKTSCGKDCASKHSCASTKGDKASCGSY
ncbi:MAG: hypothetical protein HOM96_03075 [Rickettsiales bacterium]|jgi:hypothetical protein|nr:hypothetical protein [Rickettsiales bacterium]